MTEPLEIVLDPYVRNAIQAITISLLLLMVILFEDYVAKKAGGR